MKRRLIGHKEKKLFIKRFFPAGSYTWKVPPGCTEVDVFPDFVNAPPRSFHQIVVLSFDVVS